MSSRGQDQDEALGGSGFVPDAQADRAVPLRSWTVQHKIWLGEKIHGTHAQWCQRWRLSAPTPSEVTVTEAAEYDDAASNEQLAWAFSDENTDSARRRLEQALARALFQDDEPGWSATAPARTLAKEIAAKACDAWLQAMSNCLGVTAPARAQHHGTAAQAFDGSLQVRLPFGPTVLRLRIEGDHVAQLLAGKGVPSAAAPSQNQQAVTPVLQALDMQSLPLSVQLAAATLTLGELHALQPGDVVTLDHQLSEPLAVRTPDGSLLGRAWLGQADGHIAVRLSPAASSSSALRPSPNIASNLS